MTDYKNLNKNQSSNAKLYRQKIRHGRKCDRLICFTKNKDIKIEYNHWNKPTPLIKINHQRKAQTSLINEKLHPTVQSKTSILPNRRKKTKITNIKSSQTRSIKTKINYLPNPKLPNSQSITYRITQIIKIKVPSIVKEKVLTNSKD